ncbi:gram-negative bacterial tonB protein [mine drainage metagenome]|uniref:Gram-negative bacterial tonB protein n=1 Tax=mine drainage metagenome TaxID=410659 RepID=A0A1J5P464_9ZZZZ
MPQPKKIKPPVSKPVVAPRPEVLAPDSTVVTTDTVANLSAPATPPAAAPELSTSPVPAVIAPLPQMATAVAKPNRSEISVVCPSQTAPVMPRTALEQGIQGVVRAQALIKDGLVKEVTILSGPRIFHNAVRTAMLQYRCTRDAAEVVAVQVFNFKIEDPAESGDELQ